MVQGWEIGRSRGPGNHALASIAVCPLRCLLSTCGYPRPIHSATLAGCLSWKGLEIACCPLLCCHPQVTTIRDDLNLTDAAITNGAIAGLAGTVAARLVMGTGRWARIADLPVCKRCAHYSACTPKASASHRYLLAHFHPMRCPHPPAVLELLGPRVGSAATLLLCSTATFGMCLATNAAAYIALRALMGFSMVCFVYCQVCCAWCARGARLLVW